MRPTGDLVYINKEGNIYFYGRKDNQIKINGKRVQLEQIELFFQKISQISFSK